MAHDAFISYSRKDRAFAVRLQKALGNYVPPRDLPLPHRRLDVFRDEEDFTGAEYYQSVDRHLHDSGKLIVLCSPAARGSQFVNDEIRRFARAKGPERIIAIAGRGHSQQRGHAGTERPDGVSRCAVRSDEDAARGGLSRLRPWPVPGRSRRLRGQLVHDPRQPLRHQPKPDRAAGTKRRALRRRIVVSTAAASVVVLAGLVFIAWMSSRTPSSKKTSPRRAFWRAVPSRMNRPSSARD